MTTNLSTTTEYDHDMIGRPLADLADALAASLPDRRILSVQIIRSVTSLNLKEAKDVVDAALARRSAQAVRERVIQAALNGDNETMLQLAARLRAIETGKDH